MQQPRKPTSKQLEGLEIAPNPNWLQSAFLGFERGIFRAPTSFVSVFGLAALLMVSCLAVLTIGFPVWVFIQVGYLAIGLMGYLRPASDARNNQSVVS